MPPSRQIVQERLSPLQQPRTGLPCSAALAAAAFAWQAEHLVLLQSYQAQHCDSFGDCPRGWARLGAAAFAWQVQHLMLLEAHGCCLVAGAFGASRAGFVRQMQHLVLLKPLLRGTRKSLTLGAAGARLEATHFTRLKPFDSSHACNSTHSTHLTQLSSFNSH